MENKPTAQSQKTSHPKQISHVYTLRDWKEYLGESLLIIFSVLLALFLGEYINKLHEKSQTRELLSNIRSEMIKNRDYEVSQKAYENNILKRIDSALNNPAFAKKIINNDEFNLSLLAPEGVVNHDLNTVAWDVAKSQNISSKVSFDLISHITEIYSQQARIAKLEDQVAKVLLDYNSRQFSNAHTTLILLRDNYKGWAFDRAKHLIQLYDDTIKLLGEEKP
jgi:hypothetical protein